MGEFKGSGSNYENPSYKGDEGDRKPVSNGHKSVAHAKGGSVSGEYDNATAKTESPQNKDKSRLSASGGGPKKGYDNAKIEQDFGFEGHGKHPKGNKVDGA